MLGRAMALAAAIAALMAAVACAVVALTFTVYALLRDVLTPAGASAAVVGICAVIAGIAAFVCYNTFRRGLGLAPRRPATVGPPPTLAQRVLAVVQERPIAAAGLAAVAGLAAFANPALVTAVLRAFTDRPRPRY